MEMFSLKDLFALEFFVRILSLISVNTTEGQMWNCIIFYFFKFFIKKEKMKWNEMRWEWNLVLNNDMRMNDMKMKPCI